jgi:hypothetical protein
MVMSFLTGCRCARALMLNQTTPAGSLGPHRDFTWPKYWNAVASAVSEPLLRAPAVLAPGERKTLAGPTGRVLRGLRPKQRMHPTGGIGAGRCSGGALRLSR